MSDPALFDRALDAIADDAGVDAIVACFCVLTGKDVDDVVDSLTRVAERTGKPVVAARTGADHLAPQGAARRCAQPASPPTRRLPARCGPLAALRSFVECARAASPPSPRRGAAARRRPPGPRTGASEQDSRSCSPRPGIPVPARPARHGPPDAAAAVAEVGGRAVVQGGRAGPAAQDRGRRRRRRRDRRGGRADATSRSPRSAAGSWSRSWSRGGVEALVGVAPSPLGPVLTRRRRAVCSPRSSTTSPSGCCRCRPQTTSRR